MRVQEVDRYLLDVDISMPISWSAEVVGKQFVFVSHQMHDSYRQLGGVHQVICQDYERVNHVIDFPKQNHDIPFFSITIVIDFSKTFLIC